MEISSDDELFTNSATQSLPCISPVNLDSSSESLPSASPILKCRGQIEPYVDTNTSEHGSDFNKLINLNAKTDVVDTQCGNIPTVLLDDTADKGALSSDGSDSAVLVTGINISSDDGMLMSSDSRSHTNKNVNYSHKILPCNAVQIGHSSADSDLDIPLSQLKCSLNKLGSSRNRRLHRSPTGKDISRTIFTTKNKSSSVRISDSDDQEYSTSSQNDEVSSLTSGSFLSPHSTVASQSLSTTRMKSTNLLNRITAPTVESSVSGTLSFDTDNNSPRQSSKIYSARITLSPDCSISASLATSSSDSNLDSVSSELLNSANKLGRNSKGSSNHAHASKSVCRKHEEIKKSVTEEPEYISSTDDDNIVPLNTSKSSRYAFSSKSLFNSSKRPRNLQSRKSAAKVDSFSFTSSSDSDKRKSGAGSQIKKPRVSFTSNGPMSHTLSTSFLRQRNSKSKNFIKHILSRSDLESTVLTSSDVEFPFQLCRCDSVSSDTLSSSSAGSNNINPALSLSTPVVRLVDIQTANNNASVQSLLNGALKRFHGHSRNSDSCVLPTINSASDDASDVNESVTVDFEEGDLKTKTDFNKNNSFDNDMDSNVSRYGSRLVGVVETANGPCDMSSDESVFCVKVTSRKQKRKRWRLSSSGDNVQEYNSSDDKVQEYNISSDGPAISSQKKHTGNQAEVTLEHSSSSSLFVISDIEQPLHIVDDLHSNCDNSLTHHNNCLESSESSYYELSPPSKIFKTSSVVLEDIQKSNKLSPQVQFLLEGALQRWHGEAIKNVKSDQVISSLDTFDTANDTSFDGISLLTSQCDKSTKYQRKHNGKSWVDYEFSEGLHAKPETKEIAKSDNELFLHEKEHIDTSDSDSMHPSRGRKPLRLGDNDVGKQNLSEIFHNSRRLVYSSSDEFDDRNDKLQSVSYSSSYDGDNDSESSSDDQFDADHGIDRGTVLTNGSDGSNTSCRSSSLHDSVTKNGPETKTVEHTESEVLSFTIGLTETPETNTVVRWQNDKGIESKNTTSNVQDCNRLLPSTGYSQQEAIIIDSNDNDEDHGFLTLTKSCLKVKSEDEDTIDYDIDTDQWNHNYEPNKSVLRQGLEEELPDFIAKTRTERLELAEPSSEEIVCKTVNVGIIVKQSDSCNSLVNKDSDSSCSNGESYEKRTATQIHAAIKRSYPISRKRLKSSRISIISSDGENEADVDSLRPQRFLDNTGEIKRADHIENQCVGGEQDADTETSATTTDDNEQIKNTEKIILKSFCSDSENGEILSNKPSPTFGSSKDSRVRDAEFSLSQDLFCSSDSESPKAPIAVISHPRSSDDESLVDNRVNKVEQRGRKEASTLLSASKDDKLNVIVETEIEHLTTGKTPNMHHTAEITTNSRNMSRSFIAGKSFKSAFFYSGKTVYVKSKRDDRDSNSAKQQSRSQSSCILDGIEKAKKQMLRRREINATDVTPTPNQLTSALKTLPTPSCTVAELAKETTVLPVIAAKDNNKPTQQRKKSLRRPKKPDLPAKENVISSKAGICNPSELPDHISVRDRIIQQRLIDPRLTATKPSDVVPQTLPPRSILNQIRSTQGSSVVKNTNSSLGKIPARDLTLDVKKQRKPPEEAAKAGKISKNTTAECVLTTATLPVANTKPVTALTINTLLDRILAWNSQWLKEQRNIKTLPPVVNLESLTPLLYSYNSFDDYQQTQTPLLLLEIWEMITRSWKESGVKSKRVIGKIHIFSARQSKLSVDFHCKSFAARSQVWSGFLPRCGDLVCITFQGIMTDDQTKTVSVFGYITKVLPFVLSSEQKGPHTSDDDIFEGQLVLRTKCHRWFPRVPLHSDARASNYEVLINITSQIRQFEALAFLPRSPLCRDILRPANLDVFRCLDATVDQSLKMHYNDSQMAAIAAASHSALQPYPLPKICLLHGPPGTGKSHTIIGIIQNIIKKGRHIGQHPKILLCAPSNAATDELVMRLDRFQKVDGIIKTVKFVRVGKVERMHPKVLEHSLDELVKRHGHMVLKGAKSSVETQVEVTKNRISQLKEQLHSLKEQGQKDKVISVQSEVDKLQKQSLKLTVSSNSSGKLPPAQDQLVRRKLLKDADVICSTLNNSGSPEMLNLVERGSVTCVIVDEACQSIELDCLIPLQYATTKLIMFGDPEQLPSTVVSQKASSELFGQSLFERLSSHFKTIGKETLVRSLNLQYRMHPEICHFPSKVVYGGNLKTDPNVAKERKQCDLTPYLVFDVSYGRDTPDSKGSVENLLEAQFLVEVCNYVLRTDKYLRQDAVGIITPYAKQKMLLRKLLADRHYKKIEVNTIDGFQGREKNVILLSCVRAQTGSGTIGFLADRRRLNVSLTRAKYALYVVGHLSSLQVDSNWKALIEDAKKRKLIVSVTSRADIPHKLRQHCFKSKH